MGAPIYDLDERDFINWRREAKGEDAMAEGDYVRLPYRVFDVRIEKEEKYANQAIRRVYRFYGDVSTMVKTRGDGSRFSDIVAEAPHWKRMILQPLFSGICTLSPDVKIARQLLQVPVRGHGPLSSAARPHKKAYGYVPGKGITPSEFYWAAAIITDTRADGKVFEAPGIVQLRRWQAVELADKVESLRDSNPNGFGFIGQPMQIVQWEPKKLVVKALFNEERYDMEDRPPVSFDSQIEAVWDELDSFLVENQAQLRGWPYDDSHLDDGWWSDITYADQVIGGAEEEEEDAPTEPEKSVRDRGVLLLSVAEMKEQILKLGGTYGSKDRRERLVGILEGLRAASSEEIPF